MHESEINERKKKLVASKPLVKSRMRKCVLFAIVHLFLITGLVVVHAYGVYPDEVGLVYSRLRALERIATLVEEYREDKGNLPNDLDSLLYYDESDHTFYFESKPLEIHGPIISKIIYRVMDNKPIISDLGRDGKEGGLGKDMDAVYPQEYQKTFLFRDFMKTEHFLKSLLFGFVLAFMISLCLYGMWRKRLVSGGSISLQVCLSIVFVLFELFLATAILGAHVYPHH